MKDPFNAIIHHGRLTKNLVKNEKLKGWKVVVKDNISVKGWPMTCASKSLQSYVPQYNADIVETLLDSSAEIVGKANMDEFGMGSRCERSIFGPTLNPLDEKKSAGGSSGGCSAAIASGQARLAIGSDTGGSVRLPASYTGTVGFKPSWGVFSRHGLVSYAPSMDTIGLMARSVGDISTAFEALISQKDCWQDPTLRALPPHEKLASEQLPLEGVRFGLVSEWMRNVEPSSFLIKILDFLDRNGARIETFSIPELNGDECLKHYYNNACIEASSTLARYSGLFFGNKQGDNTSTSLSKSIGIDYNNSNDRRNFHWNVNNSFEAHIQQYQSEMFNEKVVDRIRKGRNLLTQSNGNILEEIERYRDNLRASFRKAFNSECFDVIIGPTAASEAPTLNTPENEHEDIFTVPANLAGLPAISIPLHSISCGTSGVIGTQLIAADGHDRLLLRIAQEMEKTFRL